MPHLTRDGVRLYYDESGAAGPPMLLVHGWCCDRTYFAPQFAHFSAKHRCIAVDLRGHGRSDEPGDGYTIPAFADDIAWFSSQLGLTKPIVVGHSMGGAIALALAAKHPELPAAIVMLDGSLVRPEAMQALMQSMTPVLESPQYREPLRQLLASALFLPSDDAARRERIIDGMCATPHRVMLSEWRSLIAHDTVSDAKACAVPALYVGAASPAADMARLRELMPHVVLAQTAAAGHFHQLEVPDQVNAMIERFLRVVGEQ